MIRATTGGVMKTYRSNLMNSFINMNKGMNTILTQRTFNSFAEDPAAAAKAFRLRKSRMMLESQYSICTDVHKKYETAVACLQSIDDVLCTKEGEYGYYMKTLTGTTLSMLNDPEGDAREQLTKVLDQMSQQIIQTMNQKYGDNFIFAGADGHNVPFEIKENKLYYRGVPVDADIPDVLKDTNGDFIRVTADGKYDPAGGYYLKMDSVTVMSKEEYDKLYNGVPDVKTYTEEYWNDDFVKNLPVEYDADGNPSVMLDSNGDVERDEYGNTQTNPDYDGVGGYYMRVDENGNETGKLISKQEYGEAVARAENAPQLLSEDDGSGTGATKFVEVDENGVPTAGGDYYVVFNGEPEDAVISEEDYKTAQLDYEKLQYLANEKNFVDIGYGFQEDPITGKLIESSAFNESLNGINFLGYGLDEDGDPRNVYSLVQKMREVAESVPEAGKWDTPTWEEFDRLVGKFEKAVSNYQTEFVDLDASTGKLKSQSELLEDNHDNVWEQYSNIEDVDMAEAITAFLWAQYSYNAALRVGNSVLSQSLMDYLS